MISMIRQLRISIFIAAIGLAAGAPGTAQAANLNISQSPLFVATNVEPNVMFTLDDSGSMQWEFMPDGGDFRFHSYMFPMPDGIYGGENYANQIPNFEDDNIHNFFGRSAANNSVFYNPDITYEPWSRADGTQLPDANPENALYNPAIPGLGGLDLTEKQRQFACWFSHPTSTNNAFGDPCNGNHTYVPITYFNYTGGPRNLRTSYQKVEINSLTPSTAIFVSPSGVTRTRAEEVQNFANWFQYHRSRVLTARGAIGRAFTEMPDQARVGFSAINKGSTNVDGVSTRTVINGVRGFNLAGRSAFYNRLYDHVLNRQGTPLRTAAEAVGEHFERTDSRGPWSTTPGLSGGDDLACRQSFHILMSDGFWNGNNPGVGNVDGTPGPTITGPDLGQGAQSFTYSAVDPFADERSDTLADVGMHYWKRDLRPDITNRVSTTAEDPAFWQHLTSFGIALGLPANAPGSVDPEEAFAAISTQSPINWGDPGNNNIDKVNDLLHFGLNGRGGFFTAERPDVFAEELGDLLLEIVSRTAATTGLSVSTTRLNTNSVAYAAEFDSTDWTGEIKAINILSGLTQWEASPGIDTLNPATRDVYTSQLDGTGGTRFDANMNPVMLSKIDSNFAVAANTVAYVRGENIPSFRTRVSRLGDIVNSRPVFVGESNEGWSRLPGAPGSTYSTFVDSKETTADMVYVGANDGMLHALNAANGDEEFAFVPRAVFSKLKDLTREPYNHKFFVDGQQVVRDAYNGGWKRVLVGSLGAGGRGIYAIDVTNPGSPDVLWELTSEEDSDLGFTFGTPLITRLGDGDWVAIFGNGYNSDDNEAILFVVDLFSGNIRNKIALEDQSGSNGLSAVAPLLDPETRLFTRRIYAGDLQGTMWRVDFNASGSASIKYGRGLFTDPDNRPIVSKPGIAASPAGGVFVYFGTGKLIEPEDRLTSNLEMEKLYAIRDAESAVNGTSGLGNPTINTNGAGQREIVGDAGVDGWVLNLSATNSPTGERALSRPEVVFGRVIFTTFEPEDDPCAPGGQQRLYLVNALTGGGELDTCQNCGVVEVGVGAPIDPPIIIQPPAVAGPGPVNSQNPFDGAGSIPGLDTVGPASGWCSVLSTLNPNTGAPLPIGPICDGRQIWRQVPRN